MGDGVQGSVISNAFPGPTAGDPWSLGIQIVGERCGDQMSANAVRSCASDPWTSLELVSDTQKFSKKDGTGLGAGPAITGGTGSIFASPSKASKRYNTGMGRRLRISSKQSELRSVRWVSSQGLLEGKKFYKGGEVVWGHSGGAHGASV